MLLLLSVDFEQWDMTGFSGATRVRARRESGSLHGQSILQQTPTQGVRLEMFLQGSYQIWLTSATVNGKIGTILGKQNLFQFCDILVNICLKGVSLAAQDQPCQKKQRCLQQIAQLCAENTELRRAQWRCMSIFLISWAKKCNEAKINQTCCA